MKIGNGYRELNTKIFDGLDRLLANAACPAKYFARNRVKTFF